MLLPQLLIVCPVAHYIVYDNVLPLISHHADRRNLKLVQKNSLLARQML